MCQPLQWRALMWVTFPCWRGFWLCGGLRWFLRLQFQGVYTLSVVASDVLSYLFFPRHSPKWLMLMFLFWPFDKRTRIAFCEFSLFYWSNYLDFLSSFLLFVPVVSPLTLWDINPVDTVCSQEQTERSLTPVEAATGQSRWITPTMGLSLLRPVLSLVVLQELIHRF